MGRPQGSRIHEHAIQATISALELDGWTLARIRNLNIPLIAARNSKVRLGGHNAYAWANEPPNEPHPTQNEIAWQELHDSPHEIIGIGEWDQYTDIPGKDKPQNGMPPFFDAITRDLDATAKEWTQAGWRVVKQYYRTPETNWFATRQPDGIAVRSNEVWAIEATHMPARRRLAVYDDYDGVVCARYKTRQVFHPEKPPDVSIQFWKQGERVH